MKKAKLFVAVLLCLAALVSLLSCKGEETGTDTTADVVYYTVSFDTGGGSALPSVRVVKDGKLTKPEEPTRDGYIFDCWMFGGEAWDFDYDTVSADMTLTAQWIDAANVYSYTTVEGGVMITGTKKQYLRMEIPSKLNGLDVVAIGEAVFADTSSEKVSEIVVASSVKSVGKNAFYRCKDIEITLKGALREVGEMSFLDCTGLVSVAFDEGLTEIPPQAFTGCTSLKSIVFPSTLEIIDENAFEDCTSLATVTLHEAVKEIRDSAFIGCDALENIVFKGTADEWNSFKQTVIKTNNNELKLATVKTEG